MGDEEMHTQQLTQEECERYSRQMLLAGVGEAGQRKLLASKVLIVGAGGLGSPVAMYLAASGRSALSTMMTSTSPICSAR